VQVTEEDRHRLDRLTRRVEQPERQPRITRLLNQPHQRDDQPGQIPAGSRSSIMGGQPSRAFRRYPHGLRKSAVWFSQLITVRCCHYSVPARLIGRRVRVMVRASEVIVFDGRTEVARHDRATTKGESTLLLDHYLEVLLKKPGALPGATALVAARKCGVFTSEHEAFWAGARTKLGDAAGTRALIEVLLLHRYLPQAVVLAGLRAAATAGATSADVVAVEARKAAGQLRHAAGEHTDTTNNVVATTPRRVVSLTERRLTDPAAVIAGLPPDRRALPTVDAYDELLTRRAAASSTTGTSASVTKTGEVS
jgi:hypothetical protein